MIHAILYYFGTPFESLMLYFVIILDILVIALTVLKFRKRERDKREVDEFIRRHYRL